MAWAQHGHGMASVNQTRLHYVKQMGKTHSKPLAAQHGRGTALAGHVMCELAFEVIALFTVTFHVQRTQNLYNNCFSHLKMNETRWTFPDLCPSSDVTHNSTLLYEHPRKP